MSIERKLPDLANLRVKARQGGGRQRIEKQHDQG